MREAESTKFQKAFESPANTTRKRPVKVWQRSNPNIQVTFESVEEVRSLMNQEELITAALLDVFFSRCWCFVFKGVLCCGEYAECECQPNDTRNCR